jgi:peptidoglycan/xylan/chitin deacetylase (PgdA/CDA1 family)
VALVAVIGIVLAAVIAVGALHRGSGENGSGADPGSPAVSGSSKPTTAASGPSIPSAQSPPRILGKQLSGEAAKAARVPILMYHSISVPTPGAALPELFVPTKDFKDQMAALKGDGYQAVTLDQVWAAWHGSGALPEKPIVLSFDDGYENQYLHALPALRDLGWPGVLNLKLLSLEQGEMTDKMIKEMLAAGWEIDSHTINHLDVTTLSGTALTHELGDSRTMLQKRFGIPVNFFCYPAGKYDDAAIAELRKDGYEGATTEIEGDATASGNPFELPRVRIDGSDGVAGMREKLAGT